MNRLQSEFHRLYLTGAPDVSGADAAAVGLVGEQREVRALVLELARPASWDVLAGVWSGVQRELEFPAPAIAVSGTEGLQLWFSLAVPISARRAHAFLVALQARFLPGVDAERVGLWPTADEPPRHARQVPALNEATGNWSAFVAQDLVGIFADTPWLDIEPGVEGQAALLRGLRAVDPALFDAAWKRLGIGVARPAESEPTPADAQQPRTRPILNLDELEFQEQTHGESFHASAGPVSSHIGAVKLGYGVTRVAPGKRAWPFHSHQANEEMFFVLSGTGTYRIGDAAYPIRAGDFIAAPAGDRGTAHQIINDSDAELRYIAVSTGIRPEIVEYPDSNKFSASAGDGFRHVGSKSDAVDYWQGED